MRKEFDPFRILQNSRRRNILRYLHRVGGSAELDKVIRYIVERERAKSDVKNLRKTILVNTLQVHIPKLRRYGLIEYDHQNGMVTLLKLPKDLQYHLEVVERGDIPWSMYYLALSLIGVVVSLLLRSLVTGVIAACFLTASLVHSFQTYDVMHIITKYLNPSNELTRKDKEEKE